MDYDSDRAVASLRQPDEVTKASERATLAATLQEAVKALAMTQEVLSQVIDQVEGPGPEEPETADRAMVTPRPEGLMGVAYVSRERAQRVLRQAEHVASRIGVAN